MPGVLADTSFTLARRFQIPPDPRPGEELALTVRTMQACGRDYTISAPHETSVRRTDMVVEVRPMDRLKIVRPLPSGEAYAFICHTAILHDFTVVPPEAGTLTLRVIGRRMGFRQEWTEPGEPVVQEITLAILPPERLVPAEGESPAPGARPMRAILGPAETTMELVPEEGQEGEPLTLAVTAVSGCPEAIAGPYKMYQAAARWGTVLTLAPYDVVRPARLGPDDDCAGRRALNRHEITWTPTVGGGSRLIVRVVGRRLGPGQDPREPGERVVQERTIRIRP